MESSDEETDSGALGPAYSLTDMLDELGSDSTSGVTSPVPNEDLNSPSHQPTPPPTTTGSSTTTTTSSNTSTTTTTDSQPAQPGGNTCTTTTTSTPSPQGQGQPEGKVTGSEKISEKEKPTGTLGKGKEVGEERSNSKVVTLERDIGADSGKGGEEVIKKSESETNIQGSDRATCESAGQKSSTMKLEEKRNGMPADAENNGKNGETSSQESGIKHSDINGNAKIGAETLVDEEPPSDEYSDDAAVSKDDPIWKRKKVIKRRKPKRILNSQSSTGSVESEGSTSSLGSANGLTVNLHPDSKGSTPERDVFFRTCDKSPSEKDVTVKTDAKDLVDTNCKETLTDSDTKDKAKTDTLKSVPGSAIIAAGTEQTGSEQSNTGSEQTGTGNEQTPVAKSNEEVDNSGYELYEFPQHRNNEYREDIYDNVPDSALYENIAGRSDPRRSTLRRGATLKGLSQEDLVSMTYQGSMKVVKVLPDHPTHSASDEDMRSDGVERTRTRTPEGIYESVSLPRAPLSPLSPSTREDEYDDFSWGSSEFESYDEDEEDLPQDGSQERISVTVEVKSRSSQEPNNQNVLNKLAAKIGPRSWSREDDEDSSTYLEVTLNMEKHPPPELPPLPTDLTPQQVKRRHIVASIVESERSYTDSLRRIVDEYEKPLLLAKPQIISKNSIKVIFYRLRDILQCHNMFHIELAEYIRVWDAQEKLGNVFTASFSKSMVFDVYSEFVNNFTLAMETAKKLAKQKQAFSDFLKLKIQNSPDKLSLFGLMVKPIQRFPQFILCLQDLLKHTSHDHHDRLALQLALTELETLTHKLNEMKRESENKHEVKKIQSAITGSRFSLKQDPNRCLVRQDDMIQMACHPGNTKSKPRRLFLMNDQLICTTVVQKDGETGLAEKFKFKWSIPVRDVEVVESEVPDLYQVQGGPGRGLIVAPKLDKSTVSPWKKELDDMMHDLAVVEQLSNLTSQLRLNYPGLNTDLLFGIQRGLQLAIQDQGDLDLCILHLSLPTKYLRTSTDKIKDEMSKHMSKHIPHKTKTSSRASRMLHTFQVQSASIKQDWLLELKNAKLSLDPNNKPGWYMPETDQGHGFRLPLFVKPLLIDITKQNTKIQCAIPVVLPSYTNPYVGVQHLWVCSNEARRGQVTIVSLHSNQPHVLESFTACDAAIVCAEYVPGYSGGIEHEHAFPQDTVWMAMETNELCVRSVVEEEREEEPLLVMDTDGDLTCLRFMDSRLYAGLADGRLAIYNRDRDGVWHIEDRLLVDLGVSSVNALLPLNHHMWVACDNKVHVVHVTARWRSGSLHHEVKNTAHEVGSAEEEVLCMVKAGVGLMVSFRGRGIIRIYNQETFNHLQDVNVASAVAKVLEGKDLGDLGIQPRRVAITFMLASKGLLWIGTDCGCTLTLPLPRLEGVPQIKGRPSVSYHAHLGPIKFIVSISCGPCQLPAPPTSPMSNQSQAGHSENDIDCHSNTDVDTGDQADTESATKNDRPATIILEGATESETNCDESYEQEETSLANESIDSGASFMDGFSMQKGHSDYLSTSMLHIPQQQGTMTRTKWTSTPDLRHGSTINLNDSEEDVNNLYNNLLQGAEYSQYDDELFMAGKRRRRPHSDMGYPSMLSQDDPRLGQYRGAIGVRTHRRASNSKYATLPVLVEDTPTYDNKIALEVDSREGSVERSFSTESGGDVSPSVPSLNEPIQPPLTHNPSRSPSRLSGTYDQHYHPPLSSAPSTISRLNPSQKSLSKSVMVVTGGEGHINWAEKNAGDSKYDDICLLLWQCRV